MSNKSNVTPGQSIKRQETQKKKEIPRTPFGPQSSPFAGPSVNDTGFRCLNWSIPVAVQLWD